MIFQNLVTNRGSLYAHIKLHLANGTYLKIDGLMLVNCVQRICDESYYTYALHGTKPYVSGFPSKELKCIPKNLLDNFSTINLLLVTVMLECLSVAKTFTLNKAVFIRDSFACVSINSMNAHLVW